MKKLTKFTVSLLSFGLASVTFYLFKKRHDDQVESQILNNIRSRYHGFPIKGTWIQKRGDYYWGGITVRVDDEDYHHEFWANRHGEVFIKN